MEALSFWEAVVGDKPKLLKRLIALLTEHQIRYCVIGGAGANAYVEPVITLDLELVVASDDAHRLKKLLAEHFQVSEAGWLSDMREVRIVHAESLASVAEASLLTIDATLRVSLTDSQLRVWIHTDPLFAGFIDRSELRAVLGLVLPVASLKDILTERVWAIRARHHLLRSRRLAILFDIARIIDPYPELKQQVPAEILSKLTGGMIEIA